MVPRFPLKGSLTQTRPHGACRGCVCPGGSRESSEHRELGSVPAGNGPPCFPGKERTHGWEKESSSSIKAKSSLTLSGESPAGIPHCEELAQVTLSSLSPCSPSASSSSSLSCAASRRAGHPQPGHGRAPTGQVDQPPAGEPSSTKTRPPKNCLRHLCQHCLSQDVLQERKNKVWNDLDEDTPLFSD